ncbi:uncharacterized protein [Takifugu rubripes]|uniref:uncharacterized protein n=1 Tax=Takifugu rubripes TaxID=31033 RepID=UPI00114569A2|nr:uncharacterized protein LOC115252019 [Takifugu rubripes]
MSEDEVSTVLSASNDWEVASRHRAVSLADHLSALVGPEPCLSSALSKHELQSHQESDVVVSRVAFFVNRKIRPSRRERAHENQQVLRILKQWERLAVIEGIQYRVTKDPLTRHKRFQFVVPESLKSTVLSGIHDNAGHQGPSARAPLENIKTSVPLELVCIDFWSAEDNNNKSVDVLVVTDHFTKLAHAFPCRDQTAKNVAKKLWDGFFCIYGFPQRIHSDQGATFESELVAELLEMGGIIKSHTTPYHPMGNGITERFNRTLGNMLRSLPPRTKQRWPQMIQSLTFVYNCTAHETTGFAPFYLMFGRVPWLPIDLLFMNVLHDDSVCDYNTYVKSLMEDLRSAMILAQGNSAVEQNHQSDQYNKRVRGLPLSVGDRVLLANKGVKGKRKLSDKWEAVVYDVVASKPDLHIYKIRDQAGNEKTVHRNLLLQVNFLPLDVSLDVTKAQSAVGVDVDVVPEEPGVSVGGREVESSRPSAIPSLSESSVDRTASWVQQQSPNERMEPDVMSCDCSTEFAGPPLVPCDEVHKLSDDFSDLGHNLTTRFGRLVKPVCRLIESMTQVESLFGTEKVHSPIVTI